jgi:hypothetical protein
MVHASHGALHSKREVHKLKAATPEKIQAHSDELEKEAVKLRETVTNKRVFPPLIGWVCARSSSALRCPTSGEEGSNDFSDDSPGRRGQHVGRARRALCSRVKA